jgi:hypothetical protein
VIQTPIKGVGFDGKGLFLFERGRGWLPESIVVAIIAFGGTLAGTFGGIITSNRLTNYRIQQLEVKVDKHNNLIERTYRLEEFNSILGEKIKVANHRIEDLERGAKA